MHSIRFYQRDHNYVGFSGDRNVILELKNKYSFFAPGYKYDKRVKLGYWDGKISLINIKDAKFYAGILPQIKEYLNEEGIEYIDETYLANGKKISLEQVDEFYKRIKGPFKPHESQALAFQNCIETGRNIVLAPTSNGKSYIIHGLNAFYTMQKKRVLLIIDRAQLVLQLKSNFVDEYGSENLYSTSTIYDEDNNTDVLITTWQSIVDNPPSWFKQFDVLIGDEVHKFKSKSLMNIIDKCGHIENRHGFTATLDNDSKVDRLTLQGMFGAAYQSITLVEQIEQGISARPIVYIIRLSYPVDERRQLINDIKQARIDAAEEGKKVNETIGFITESKFLEQHVGRNNFIANLVSLQRGNTLVAFKNKEHGKTLYETIEKSTKLPLFFANSTVSKEKRFEIQKKIQSLKESVGVVSFGTFSTGVNITSLNNLIIGSQVKSSITIPQLIGRMIRLSEGKTTANIIDICDDLTHNNNKNVFYSHFEERMKFYLKNNFEIRTRTINL